MLGRWVVWPQICCACRPACGTQTIAFTASRPGAASSGPQTSKLLQADDRGDRLDEGDLAESILSCRRESLCQLRTQFPEVGAAFLGMQRVGHDLDHISVLDQGDRVLDVLPSGVIVRVGEDRARGTLAGGAGLASRLWRLLLGDSAWGPRRRVLESQAWARWPMPLVLQWIRVDMRVMDGEWDD